LSYRAPFPVELEHVEYVKLFFSLKITTCFYLPSLGLLQLRGELLRGIKFLSDDRIAQQLQQFLQPSLPSDPIVRRQIQKPAPALIISPELLCSGLIEAGEKIILPVIFIGTGIMMIDAFISLLQYLGRLGIYRGTGWFELETIEVEDDSGFRSILWFNGQQPAQVIPPVCNLSWWLERQDVFDGMIKFEMMTPLRLLRHGKPIFRAKFATIFPFLLRRVTAMLTYHSGIEFRFDPSWLISLASQVESTTDLLRWQDWRILECNMGVQNLGGMMGEIILEGDELAELIWILQLGTMLNFGKGAAYGAGQYQLNYC